MSKRVWIATGVAVLVWGVLVMTSGVAPAGEQRSAVSEGERVTQRELRELARAWSDGGGRFGYPFWDRAAHRWRDGEIPTALFREYVSGYRDNLVAGCALIKDVKTGTEVGRDVKRLVSDACGLRLDTMRTQKRWLDELIRRDAQLVDDPEQIIELEQRLAQLEKETNASLQESWRDTRLAMDIAQAELDAQGVDRLAEDAFV